MPLPQGQGFPELAQGNSQLYDQFNSMNPVEQPVEPAPENGAKAEAIKLSDRFSNVFRQFQDLTSSYPAGDEAEKFKKDAINAMSNWLNLAVQKLNSPSGNEGPSTY